MTTLPAPLARLLEAAELDEDELRLPLLEEPLDTTLPPEQLEARLADHLYRRWHAGMRTPDGLRVAPRDTNGDGLLGPLVQERSRQLCLTDGWTIDHRDEDGVVAHRADGLRLRFPPKAAPDASPGDVVTLPMPSVRPLLSPGFCIFDGIRGWADAPKGTMRLYAHLRAEDGPDALRAVIAALDGLGARFRVKGLAASRSYPRYDALVLYLAHDAVEALAAGVETLSPLVDQAGSSPLASPLAPGIGFSWEPLEQVWPQRSFGQHRAGLLAAAIAEWTAAGGLLDLPDLAADHLARAGVDPERPWREFASPADPVLPAAAVAA
jgi:hypothetical protein